MKSSGEITELEDLVTATQKLIRLHKIEIENLESEVRNYNLKIQEKRMAAIPPVDRSAVVLTDGRAVTPDHKEINPDTGQQKGYVVLTESERAKGFVRPVRRSYVHKVCGVSTTMSTPLAETYARDPNFYDGTFCSHCREHYPVAEFVWEGTEEVVGS